MKKIGKITANPEKIIKNEELVNLKGGYDEYECQCSGERFFCTSKRLLWSYSECN